MNSFEGYEFTENLIELRVTKHLNRRRNIRDLIKTGLVYWVSLIQLGPPEAWMNQSVVYEQVAPTLYSLYSRVL